MTQVLFKSAETEAEFQQIHALNHRIFAEEIAQHPTDPSRLLVDRLDSQNHYFIAVHQDKVIGMVSAHSGPAFSVSRRLPAPQTLSDFPRPFEVRLLAIHPAQRNRTVLSGLLWQVYDFALSNRGSHLLISAITEREPMYRKLGFEPLGPAVPEGAASFIPMVADLANPTPGVTQRASLHQRHWQRGALNRSPISLMPGPVCIHPEVARAFASPPISHRSPDFIRRYERTRNLLRGLLPNMDVAIFPGAGTLANDIVAANLKAVFAATQGIILSNGEFGERIANQARRAGLNFTEIRSDWGQPWDFPTLQSALDREPAWVWAVHLETSTGVLNDAGTLLSQAQRAGCAVALDCVSSLGASTIPTSDALLFASGVSGKSIGSYAGIGFVYVNRSATHLLVDRPLCPSFDLLHMLETCGPVSTISSPALLALCTALEQNYSDAESMAARFAHYASLGICVRQQMMRTSLTPLAPCEIAAPNITTFRLPSHAFPKVCLDAGFHIAFESPYLEHRGWGQIATMGDVSVDTLVPLFRALTNPAGESVFPRD